jgi:hypothetical protein
VQQQIAIGADKRQTCGTNRNRTCPRAITGFVNADDKLIALFEQSMFDFHTGGLMSSG